VCETLLFHFLMKAFRAEMQRFWDSAPNQGLGAECKPQKKGFQKGLPSSNWEVRCLQSYTVDTISELLNQIRRITGNQPDAI